MILQTVPMLLQDRHTISDKQQPMLLESTHDLAKNLRCSDTTCCARSSLCNNQWGTKQQRDIAVKYPKTQEQITRKKANRVFNEIRQFAYVLGARERFYWFNDQVQVFSCI